MGLFSFLRRLGSADGTRNAMRRSYGKHRRELDQRQLPPGTSLHDAALYGALASRYKVSGANPEKLEPFIWFELVPFRCLDEGIAPDVLAEYVVWKEKETHYEARTLWLSEQLEAGVKQAFAEDPEMIRQAYGMGPGANYKLPWTALVTEPTT